MALPQLKSGRYTLDRLFSKLGLASRGVSENWIRSGRVQLNGQLVKNPNTWITWPSDSIRLDGQALCVPEKRFFLFHKPKGYVTTHSDEKGRKTVFDIFPTEFGFIHAVGRLDQATSGLLLLTNDSEISSFLTDPIHAIPRVYLASVRGLFTEEKLKQALLGVTESGELLRCDEIKIQKKSARESHLELVLSEGKNREIRRLLKTLGHEVIRLRRIEFGPFQLGRLGVGEWKEVGWEDVLQLLKLNGAKKNR